MGASPRADRSSAALDADLMQQRYGVAKPVRRRTVVILAGVLTVIALGVGAWIAVGHLGRSVTTQDVGFAVAADQRSVDVTFDITMPPNTTAVCTLESLDARYGQVGLLDAAVGPMPNRVNRVTFTVATSAPPVTGFVRSCDVID